MIAKVVTFTVCAAVGILGCVCLGSSAPRANATTPTHRRAGTCGEVTARGQRYLVRVRRGAVGCRKARHVIERTLSTGPVSMGSPGRPPRRWQCGWNYYKFPHGGSVRAGASCSRGRSEVLGDWRPHLLHCQDVTASSTTGATFTAHDVFAYRLGCGSATSWITTFFTSVADPSEEAYTGPDYGCGGVSGGDAGCVGTSGRSNVYFELR